MWSMLECPPVVESMGGKALSMVLGVGVRELLCLLSLSLSFPSFGLDSPLLLPPLLLAIFVLVLWPFLACKVK